jgi:hypothetical protein
MAISSDKLLNRPSELHRRYGGRLAMKEDLQKKMVSGGPSNIVLTKKSVKDIGNIKVNVIKIESILKGTLAAEKKSLDTKKRQESGKRREKQEEKLETKPQAEKGPIKMPKVPRMGFLDWVKNFIGNVILGYFAVRLIDYLPKIKPIIKFLGSAADFLIDTGGKLLDGLVTFIDWGYKAIDFTRGMMKSIGGENFAKVFDGFTGAVGTLVETAIIAATVLATQGDGGVLDIGMDMLKDRLLGQGAQRAAQAGAQAAGQAGGTAAQAGGIGAGAVAGIVAGAGLLASALGEGAFQVRKVVVKPIQNLEKAYKEDKNPLTKIGRGIALNMVRPLYGVFSTVGFLLDVVGAPFRYAIELLRFPFLSEEDKQKQANNLAKFDARIREDLRKALNMVTLGLAFKEKGSFGNIYGNKGAQKEMMGKMAGGGITRGGKSRGGIKRTVTKGKYKRVLARKPSKTQFKGDPKDLLVKTGEQLDKTKYFGPVLAVSTKLEAKEEPTQKDYENVGLGLNLLIAKGLEEKQLKGGLVAAFAEGGMVDDKFLEAAEKGVDISSWISKTFRDEFETNAQKTLRMIRENAEKKKSQEVQKPPSPDDMGDGTNIEGAELSGSIAQKAFQLAKIVQSRFGLKDFQAAAIVGTWLREGFGSGHPDVKEGGKRGAPMYDAPRTGGYGFAQWTNTEGGGPNDRLNRALIYLGMQNNPRPWTVDDNLKVFEWETKKYYSTLWPALKKTTSLQDAVRTFVGIYEAGGMSQIARYEAQEAHLGGEGFLGRRLSSAQSVLKTLQTGKDTAGNALKMAEMPSSSVDLKGGSGKFIQGNSGASGGVHFHIGPGTQPGQVDTKYNADARKAAQQVVKHFLGKKSLYDGRRGASYTSGSDEEIMAAQKAHSAYGSQGGIDIQVGGAHPGAATRIPFPFAVTNMAERPGGFGVSAKIAGLNAFVAHGRYNESGKLATQLGTRSSPPFTTAEGYAFHGKSFGIVPKGGMKLNLHEGEMYKVVDKDSVNLFGYDLTREIIDIENKAQLVSKAPSIIERLSAIAGYAPYDALSPQTIIMPTPSATMGDYSDSDSSGFAMAFVGGGDDPFETLYQGG